MQIVCSLGVRLYTFNCLHLNGRFWPHFNVRRCVCVFGLVEYWVAVMLPCSKIQGKSWTRQQKTSYRLYRRISTDRLRQSAKNHTKKNTWNKNHLLRCCIRFIAMLLTISEITVEGLIQHHIFFKALQTVYIFAFFSWFFFVLLFRRFVCVCASKSKGKLPCSLLLTDKIGIECLYK